MLSSIKHQVYSTTPLSGSVQRLEHLYPYLDQKWVWPKQEREINKKVESAPPIRIHISHIPGPYPPFEKKIFQYYHRVSVTVRGAPSGRAWQRAVLLN